jgi:hypothetical protein
MMPLRAHAGRGELMMIGCYSSGDVGGLSWVAEARSPPRTALHPCRIPVCRRQRGRYAMRTAGHSARLINHDDTGLCLHTPLTNRSVDASR